MRLDKGLREVLKLGVKTLVLQEVRYLRMERVFTPEIILDEVSRSIAETKREIVGLTRTIRPQERASLLRRMARQALDEEIERAIQLRKNRCLRCTHGRFYDECGTAFKSLPSASNRVWAIGCDQLRPGLRKSCRRFVETSTAPSLGDHLDEMNLLYEFRDLIDRINEIWKDYLTT